MKNKIEDLRNHLFATLEALQDQEKPMEIERAREIANVAKVIVDSARAEVDFLKATGAVRGTGFIPVADGAPAASARLPAAAAETESIADAATPLRVCGQCEQRTRQDPCEHCGARWKRVA